MKYSMQEAFSVCYQHVIKQGEPAIAIMKGVNKGFIQQCKYKLDELSCAVGGPIAAAGVYKLGMEGCNAHGLLKNYPEEMNAAGFYLEHASLLLFMQDAHDEAAAESLEQDEDGFTPDFIALFKVKSERVAARYDLECK